MTAKILGDREMFWLEERGIDGELAARFGIYTGRWDDDRKEVVPDVNGRVIVFPYFERDIVVAEHYRTPPKKFSQRSGGKKTFWNADVLDDPALERDDQFLVVTEGEIDALTAIRCGFPLTISVPDGAPAVPQGRAPTDLDPLPKDAAAEQTGKFEYLFNNKDRLTRIKRFVIAVDNDPPGQRLAAELVRRLLPSRCMFVTYPEGSKDLNAVWVNHGPEGVARVINGRKPYPVRGLYRLSEYPAAPELEVYSTGWDNLDTIMKLYPGEFMVVTGIPSHGKSSWVLNLLVNLHYHYGWRAAVFSPEMPAVPFMRAKLRKIIGSSWSWADEQIEDAFVFIDADPTDKSDEDDLTLDWIIDRATDAVLRDGVRVLVIDPWNEVEHAKTKGEPVTEYLGASIRKLKRWGKMYGVVVIVVAHPTKDVAKDGKTRTPTLYDIDGSAHWFNKCDHGVIVERPDPELDVAKVWMAKSRFEAAGVRGNVKMAYDRDTDRFTLLDEDRQQSLLSPDDKKFMAGGNI